MRDAMRLLHDFLLRSARRLPEKTALVCGEQRVSYAEVVARANQLAWALRRRGVDRGDRVLIFAGNTVEMVISFWGVLAANAVAVPVSPLTKPDKLVWLLEHCSASALISEGRLAAAFAHTARRASTLRATFVSALTDGAELPGQVDFAAALDAETADEPPPRSVSETDLAALLYTSGSTGRPKGVMLAHGNMTSAAASICRYLELREDDVVHGLSPMAFDYGLYQLLLSFRQGARLVLAPPFTLPAQVLKQAAIERVTFFPGVPTQFSMLADLKDASQWDLSSVRAVTSTAAALTSKHIKTVQKLFPRAQIFSMYGLTECKRCTYLPPEDLARKPDSVGIAIPDTELWLVDEQDRQIGAGQAGQLVIRGAHVMRGYWNDPEETALKLRPGPMPGERVLYTGDLCRLDDEGYLYFVGRLDDIIKSRGEKVAPKEVEIALQTIAGVREAAVIGVADELRGQAVKAFVVAEDGATLRESDLLRACRERLESFMVPTQLVLVPSLPKTATGKIDKLQLR
jgi:amino acid adenylation domain-containing protein